MSTSWRWRATVPFLAVAVLAQVSLGWPLVAVERPGAALASALLVLALLAVAALARWRRIGWLQGVVSLAFLAVVALWRHADGGSTSALTAMVGLSVLWLALHGTLRMVWASVVGVALVLGGPLLLVGGADYPVDDWPRAALWTAFAALLGPLTHAVVSQREAVASRVRALEPSDSRFRGLLGAASEHAIVAVDLDGLITVFNTGAERLLGWREEQVIGRLPLLEIFAVSELGLRARELDTPVGLDVLVHAARAGESETRDWTWLTRSGERRTVSLSVSGVRDADDRLTGYIAIANDVTKARRAEAALVAQQDTVRLMLDHLPDTVIGVLDRDLRWLQVGGQWITRRGVSIDSIVGCRLGERLPIGDPVVMHRFMTAAFERPDRAEFETESGVWFEIDAVPVSGPGGEALLVVCREVTARHTADAERADMVAALTASEEGFRTAFESAPVGIALSSVDQGPDARFLRVNEAFAAMLGRSREAIEALSIDAITDPEHRNERTPVVAGRTEPHSTRYLHASGRSIWVSTHSSLVADSRGRPAYVITHVADMTSRHASETALYEALEQQREAATVLEQADALRTETMSTISHELRTPLTSIEGYLELLADEVPGPLNADQDRMLDVVRRNSSRLRALVDDLLVLSRLDDTAKTSARAPVDLGEVCRVVLETLRPLADARSQRLDHRAPSGPAMVIGDAEQLDRVLMNLVANAIKYTPEAGQVEVVLLDQADGSVRLEVRDTGIGIPIAEQQRLFERFFRASTAERLGIEGTGLGLAIAQSIVERHHGTIAVTSQPDVGSCFSIVLPASGAAAGAGVLADVGSAQS